MPKMLLPKHEKIRWLAVARKKANTQQENQSMDYLDLDDLKVICEDLAQICN